MNEKQQTVFTTSCPVGGETLDNIDMLFPKTINLTEHNR